MCNLETEGIQYGCGHYVITRQLKKIDCGKASCIHSRRHVTPCYNCDYHEKFLGPDAKETILKHVSEYCDSCRPFWFKDGAVNSSRRR